MKILISILVIVCSLLPILLTAQQKPNFVGDWYHGKSQGKQPERVNAFQKKTSDFPRTKRYNLNANINQLNGIMNSRPEVVDLIIPYGDKTYTLNLALVDITTESFSINTDKGKHAHQRGAQYRGIVDNNPAHIASFNLTSTDKSGYFSTDEGNFVVTEDGVDFIVYNDQVMELPATILCVTPASSTPITIDKTIISGVGCKTFSVYFECDYAFYQSKSGNLTTLTNYIAGFFNQVATLYANEDIAIQIAEIFVWTTPDPYAALTTTSAILNQFKTTRGTSFNGNLAHFLTTRNVGGGVAYVDAICSKAYAYGVSMIYTTYNNVPAYSWTVNVVAHELGHNLGSPHTQSCTWPGGPIDNCVPQEGTCSPGPAPVGGGTIMSYCHTTSYGINFNNGFGPLPGNLIRNRVQNASCISAGNIATPPSTLSTNNITANGATLTWNAIPSTLNYTVQYKLASSSTWITAGSTSSTTFNLTGLSGNANYNWQVKTDCSAYSTSASFTTGSGGSTTCSAPASLTTTNISTTGATLNWGTVIGATGYTVQYRPSTASTWTSLNTTTNSTSITGLTAGITYTWQVKADCSGYSASVNFTTGGSATCNTPVSLTTTNITASGAKLNWGVVIGATGYTVQYRRSTTSTWTSISSTTNSANLTGLTAGSAYIWQVKANCSGYSSTANFTTSTSSGCTMPTNTTESNITSSTAKLSWTAAPNAQSYQVRYRIVGFSGWSYRTTSSPSYPMSGLQSKRQYEWSVNTKCTNGTSSTYTALRRFTTL